MGAGQLRGQQVLEAGVRQAWPFLTFTSPHPDSERRLYIDTGFAIEPDGQRCDDGDAFRAAAALIAFSAYTVTEVETTLEGGLALTFNDQKVLRIDGVASSFSAGEPWWIGAL